MQAAAEIMHFTTQWCSRGTDTSLGSRAEYTVHYYESPFSEGGAHSTLLPEVVEFPASSLLLVPITDSSFGAALGSKVHPYMLSVLAPSKATSS